jgi:hypothetical protein
MEWRNVKRLSLPLLRRKFEGRDVRKAEAHFEIGRLVPNPYMQLFPYDGQKNNENILNELRACQNPSLLANEAARASHCLEDFGLKKEAGPHTCLAFDEAFSTPAERLSLRVRGGLLQKALIRTDDSSRTVSPSSRSPYVLSSNETHSESSISAKFSTQAPTPRPTLSEKSDRHRDLFLTSRRHACTTSLDA